MRLVALVRQRPDLTLVPPAALKLTLDEAGGSGWSRGRPSRPPAAPALSRQPWQGRRAIAGAPRAGGRRGRATGEVTPGFTKEEILRPAKDDPRAPGGVFERVGGLLSELLDQG